MFIYIIKRGGSCKVGQSVEPLRRMRHLQMANPNRLELIETFEVADHEAGRIERSVHRRLRRLRIVGEWFKATPEQCRRAIRREIGRPDGHGYGDEIVALAIATLLKTPSGRETLRAHNARVGIGS